MVNKYKIATKTQDIQKVELEGMPLINNKHLLITFTMQVSAKKYPMTIQDEPGTFSLVSPMLCI